jgi:competence protein ComEC
VALAAWRRSPGEVFLLAAAAAVVTRRRRVGVGVAVLAIIVVGRSTTVHDGLVPDELGGYAGWVAVAADPDPSFSATRLLLEIEGERFETWVRGRAGRLRVETWQQGDQVWVAGTRRPLDQHRAGRVAWQHVVGAFDHDVLGDRVAGGRLDVASNRVRSLISAATSSLNDEDGALARGLIVGDDAGQTEAMTERFRRSGLSHLTAVSGQNVALALAITAPWIQRVRPGLRLGATLVVIGWFVILTRAEPSVLRAGTMAALSALAFTLGAEREPPRLLAGAIVVLLLVDPLLVRSIGFWLSVGATAGVTVIGPPLRTRLAVFGPLANPLAMTAAAQLGVLLPSVLVFGQLSVSGIVANLCAVPVAGLVMLYGLPASLVAGAVPAVRSVLMAPVALGTRWVDAVAAVAAALERHPPWNVVVVVVFLGGSLCAVRASGRHEAGRGTQQ